MRRDMDLVRAILLAAADRQPGARYSSHLQIAGFDEPTVAEHLLMMEEAGLIEANVMTVEGLGARHGTVKRITWHGQDFLQHAENERVWRRAKAIVVSSGVGLTVELLKDALKTAAQDMLNRGG